MGFLGEVPQEQAKHKRVPKSLGQVLKWERKERATEKKRQRCKGKMCPSECPISH